MRMKTRGCWPLALSALQHQAFMNAEETEKIYAPQLFHRPRGLFSAFNLAVCSNPICWIPDGLLDFQISMSAVNGMIYAVWDYCYLYLYRDNTSRLSPPPISAFRMCGCPQALADTLRAPCRPYHRPRQSVQLAVHLYNTLDKFRIHRTSKYASLHEPLEPTRVL